MEPKRAVAAFFLSQMLAAAAFTQSAATAVDASAPSSMSSEFGRVSGGAIDLMTKHSQPFSGSVAITASRSQLPFGSGGSGKGYGATLGGTLVPDRIWFFASAQQSEPLFASRYGAELPERATSDRATSRAADAKMIAQFGDRQSLAASFSVARQSGVTTSATLAAPIPSSFLSLHYTGIVSDNMFVSASFSKLQPSNPRN